MVSPRARSAPRAVIVPCPAPSPGIKKVYFSHLRVIVKEVSSKDVMETQGFGRWKKVRNARPAERILRERRSNLPTLPLLAGLDHREARRDSPDS